jgi:hypothetical protein
MSETDFPGGWHAEPPAALPPPLPPAVPSASPWRSLWAGVRIALLGRPKLEGLSLGPGTFWLALAANVLLASLWAWLASEAPREFKVWGLEQECFFFLPILLCAWLVARAAARPELLWRFAVLLGAAWLVMNAAASLFYDHLLPYFGHEDDAGYWAVYGLLQLWSFSVLWHLLTRLQALRGWVWRGLAALLMSGGFALLAHYLPYVPMWDQAEPEDAQQDQTLIAEDVFGSQDQLLDKALDAIEPSRPGHPSLYFVAYAPDGEQDVFMKEARYGTELFRRRFGAAGRTLTLVNNRQTVDQLPLATVSNLDYALRAIGQKMNRQQDILFLYLTSHGSPDAELATSLEDFSFEDFTAGRLAEVLRDSGIRWKVIVVSACYSGSFLNRLKDDHTLVITAARSDRTSFGCSDDAEFTYFGRAYLQKALNQTTSFTEAFKLAKSLVNTWEARDHETPSEPQIAVGADIGAKLEQWRATLGEGARLGHD